MRFQLFGIPTEVQFSFWIGSILLGLPYLSSEFRPMILVWVAVVFISVLVHELGHALAIRRHGLHPEITLHWIGGLTSWSGANNLTRPQRVFISFAGPLAGFILAGLVYGLTRAFPGLLAQPSSNAEQGRYWALQFLVWVNFFWGVVNLAPVLPLDGGHILEHALGPKRLRVTAVVSLVVGAAIAAWAFVSGMQWMGFLFAMCALQSFQRYQAETPVQRSSPRTERGISEPPMPIELERELKRARDALNDDRYDEAASVAEAVLAKNPPRSGRIEALEVLAWAKLLDGKADEAARLTRAIERHGRSDVALAGAVLFAKKDFTAARAVFETARSIGDDRKEIVGPLIQILIAEGEVARAAAIAFDVVETLSDEDARQMAEIAFDHHAHGWSARLAEAVFERTGDPLDAYYAARARSLEGNPAASFTLLERAVAAGFRDAQRMWSDDALRSVHHDRKDELSALLPKP
jgi:Zn-dependent protease/thioredoxin-like negative regulator of GroEL